MGWRAWVIYLSDERKGVLIPARSPANGLRQRAEGYVARMDPEPTSEELRAWWDGLDEAARASLRTSPQGQVPEEHVDAVMSYQNGITTFARWDRGLRSVHLRDRAQDFVREQ